MSAGWFRVADSILRRAHCRVCQAPLDSASYDPKGDRALCDGTNGVGRHWNSLAPWRIRTGRTVITTTTARNS